MKYMRITAMGARGVCVQTSDHRDRDYEQVWMGEKDFTMFMKTNFPVYWEAFVESDSLYPIDFFYNYGETEEMMRKGEAFVYEMEVQA